MRSRNFGYMILFALASITSASCEGDPKDPLQKQGASTAVRPAVPENWQDNTMADTVSMDRMDTATNPTMDGKP